MRAMHSSWTTTFVIYCTSLALLPPVGATLWPDSTVIYASPSNHSIIVFDNIMPEADALALHSYLLRFAQWKLNDRVQETATLNQTVEQGCEKQGNLPWTAQLSSAFNENLCFLKTVLSSPKLLNFTPHSVQAEMLRRGDSIKVRCGSDEEGYEYSWRVFLTSDWQSNDYGDLTFYDRNATGGNQEAVFTVHPRLGRLVLWDAFFNFVYHPPSMGYIQGLLSVTGQLTTSESLDSTFKRKSEDELSAEQTSKPQFPSQTTHSDELSDLANKYVRSFHDSKGRVISVYDNIFLAADLEQLEQALSALGEVHYMPHDVQHEEDVDNAQWIQSFDPEKFAASAVWRGLSEVMRHISGNRTSWYPYDVALNIVRSADHTRIHQDCDEWEDEYTMVLYLNPGWQPEFYGETVFFEAIPGSELHTQLYGPGAEYQPIAAVLPQYGRLAVFQGIIPHSARPPSGLFRGARYTFAVKVSLTRRIALAKQLQEVLEDSFEELATEDEQLLEDLISGVYNHEPSFRSDEWLEKRLQDAKREASRVINKKKHQLLSSLFTCE